MKKSIKKTICIYIYIHTCAAIVIIRKFSKLKCMPQKRNYEQYVQIYLHVFFIDAENHVDFLGYYLF